MSDINIHALAGFYAINGASEEGRIWIDKNVDGGENGVAASDQVSYTQDIAEGALEAGLIVEVNGRRYLGNNAVQP